MSRFHLQEQLIFKFCAMTFFVASVSQATMGQRIDAIPVDQVPASFLQPQQPKSLNEISHLQRPAVTTYTIDTGDTLAIFVEGILGALDENPPVQIPLPDSNLPPSIGFPVPVREDGIDLPQIGKVPVKGLTVAQVEALVKRVYTEGSTPVLQKENRILVTLFRERTYRVTVVRQDLPRQSTTAVANRQRGIAQRFDKSARTTVLQLPAYQNDVLTALLRTGGLPGLNAKSAVRIERSARRLDQLGHSDSNLTFGKQEFPRSKTRGYANFNNETFYPSQANSRTSQLRKFPNEQQPSASQTF